MSDVQLRILNPTIDLDLFCEAYSWRQTKRHAQPDRAPFEAFIADDPRQTVVGVFNGQFCAAFLLYEWQERYFEAHFTSKRGTARETLVDAGLQIRDAFLQNGAIELCAWITARNTALAGYLDALGFTETRHQLFPCQNVSQCPTIQTDTSEPPTRMFIKYAVTGERPSV